MRYPRLEISIVACVLAALAGGLALWQLPALVESLDRARELGPGWFWSYVVALIVAAVALVGGVSAILWKLLARSREGNLRREKANQNPSALSLDEMNRQIEDNERRLAKLRTKKAFDEKTLAVVAEKEKALATRRELKKLEIVAFGSISSGKSSLLNLLAGKELFAVDARGGTTVTRNEIPLPGVTETWLVDTPGLGEIDGATHVRHSTEAAKNADVVLLVVDGPLRQTEVRLAERLAEMEKRILVCVNKSDWYSPGDQEKLKSQIAEQTGSAVKEGEILFVRSQPTHRTRTRLLADGSEIDEQVVVPADIAALTKRLERIVREDGERLRTENVLGQSRRLVQEAEVESEIALDKKARRIVDMHMWGAASAAAAVPSPALDLVAGAAINVRMALELAKLYDQKFDYEDAKRLLTQMGKILILNLGLSAGAPIAASAVGSMFKTVPGVGTIAGASLQFLANALVTRWVGYVLIEYFKHKMKLPEGGLAGIARKEWERLTTVAELRKLWTTAREKLPTQRSEA